MQGVQGARVSRTVWNFEYLSVCMLGLQVTSLAWQANTWLLALTCASRTGLLYRSFLSRTSLGYDSVCMCKCEGTCLRACACMNGMQPFVRIRAFVRLVISSKQCVMHVTYASFRAACIDCP